ncbi:PnuC-like nicotinamide riboside transporter [Microbacterium phage StrawberryJamm]|nr:PnuC-like nicotinamide riboside transporter [Microbacterium phage StrawberryJamm]
MNDLIWSWLLTIVGATCFYLAGGLNGRKVWWAWYIGLFAQVLWATYAFLDLEHRMGFLVGVALYGFVYVRNCINWTREHRAEAAIRKLQRPYIRRIAEQLDIPVEILLPKRRPRWLRWAPRSQFQQQPVSKRFKPTVRETPPEPPAQAPRDSAALLVPTGWHVPAEQFYSPYGATPEEHNAAVTEIQRTEDEALRAALDATRPRRGGPKFAKGPSTEELGS